MAKQRLILLFDGTWNDPEDQTNVFRIASLIKKYDRNVRQRFFYDSGVGTGKFDRFRGGVLAYGLSENLLQGYEWLAKRYVEDDEIWVFGFSRGAYTARSLVGLIGKCGLLHIVTPSLLDMSERIYRNKDLAKESNYCKSFRQRYSRSPRIHFIGVWDTVGALGVPGTSFSEHGKYSWNDTELSSIVDYAYHAVALDEHRAAYETPLWVSNNGDKNANNREVEQRWFIGAHANVGGGYGSKDLLPDISLQWMVEKACNVGLKMNNYKADGDAWKTNPRDSFGEFLYGAYAFSLKIFGKGRYFRPFDRGIKGKKAVNVTVDPSVWSRWKDPKLSYRPPTLEDAVKPPPKPQGGAKP